MINIKYVMNQTFFKKDLTPVIAMVSLDSS